MAAPAIPATRATGVMGLLRNSALPLATLLLVVLMVVPIPSALLDIFLS